LQRIEDAGAAQVGEVAQGSRHDGAAGALTGPRFGQASACGVERQLDLLERCARSQRFQRRLSAQPRCSLGEPRLTRTRAAQHDQSGALPAQFVGVQLLILLGPASVGGDPQLPLDRCRSQGRASELRVLRPWGVVELLINVAR
jgi:hypothetical protein